MKSSTIIKISFFILWILFQIVTIPFLKENSFWIGYLFSNLVFLIEIILVLKKNRKHPFLNLSSIYISTIYLIVQISVFLINTLFLKQNIGYVYIFIFSLFVLLLTFSLVGKNEIEKKEEIKRKNVEFVKIAQMKIESMFDKNEESSVREILDILRYSDKASIEKTIDIENKILENLEESNLKDIKNLLLERNRIIKNNK